MRRTPVAATRVVPGALGTQDREDIRCAIGPAEGCRELSAKALALTAGSGSRQGPLASIVVTCKGRLHHLQRTLPSALVQAVLLLLRGYRRRFRLPARHVRLAPVPGRAKPGGGERSWTGRTISAEPVPQRWGKRGPRHAVLAFVDADIFPDAIWLETVARVMRDRRLGLCTVADGFRAGWDRGGTCVVSAEVFHAVRGYDEALQGWGSDDADFYSRCAACRRGRQVAAFLLSPIKHGDEDRVRYHADKDMAQVTPGIRGACRNAGGLSIRTVMAGRVGNPSRERRPAAASHLDQAAADRPSGSKAAGKPGGENWRRKSDREVWVERLAWGVSHIC